MTARSQKDERGGFQETRARRKKERPERHGNGLVEQEADRPLQDQAFKESEGSYVKEKPWTTVHGVDSSAGGRQADAAEVASIVEEVREMYPNRSIFPAIYAFVRTLLDIGLTKPQVCRMFRRDKNLFARSSKDLLERRKLLAQHGVSAAGFHSLLQRDTWSLSKSLQEVEGTILYVKRLLGVPGEAVARVFTAYPSLLGCSEANLEEKVQALQRVGLREVARVIPKHPVLLIYTPQKVADTVAALEVVLEPEQATALLARDPRVLRVRTSVLREQLAWLEKTFGRAAARHMAMQQPSVAGARGGTASTTYAGFVGTFGEARARLMLLLQPGLLTCKWCMLHAKVDFVTTELGYTLDELASWPTALTYSLEGRMRPRAAALRAVGKTLGRLSTALSYTAKKFEQVYGVCLRRAATASSKAEASQGSRG